MRLKMVCDIEELVRRRGTDLDWQALGARARQWGAARAVYVVLRLAQELLEADIPAAWLVSLRPAEFDEVYLEQARRQILIEYETLQAGLRGTNYHPHLSKFWAAKGLKNKLGVIYERLLPRRETLARSMTRPLPVNSWRITLYYAAHIRQTLAARSMAFWRLARGDEKSRAIAEHTNQATTLRDWLLAGHDPIFIGSKQGKNKK
jgi:hypothetical protein